MNNDYNDTTPSRVKKNANLYRRIDAASIDDIEPRREEEIIDDSCGEDSTNNQFINHGY